jgi:hypothetical protein
MRIACGAGRRQAVITGAPGPGAAAKGAATWCGWRWRIRRRGTSGRDRGHHVRCPGQAAAHLGHGHPLPRPAGRDQLADQGTGPGRDVRRVSAQAACGRDRLKALPAEPDRWDSQPAGDLYAGIYQALPVAERGAWLTSHGFVIRATKNQVSVIQGDARDSSPGVTVVCSGMKAQPFQVAVNTSPQDGQPWLLVSWPGIHVPSNRLPQPGQSSGECSVILIPGRSSPLPASRRDRRGSGCRNRLAYHPGFRFPLRC